MKPVISRFHLLGIRRLVGLVGCVVSIAVDRRNRRNVDAVSGDFFVQAKRYVFLFALEFNFFVEKLSDWNPDRPIDPKKLDVFF